MTAAIDRSNLPPWLAAWVEDGRFADVLNYGLARLACDSVDVLVSLAGRETSKAAPWPSERLRRGPYFKTVAHWAADALRRANGRAKPKAWQTAHRAAEILDLIADIVARLDQVAAGDRDEVSELILLASTLGPLGWPRPLGRRKGTPTVFTAAVLGALDEQLKAGVAPHVAARAVVPARGRRDKRREDYALRRRKNSVP